MFSVFCITYVYLLINHYANNSGINATKLKCEWKQGCIHSFGMYKLRVYLKYTKVSYMRNLNTSESNQLSGQIFRDKAILRAEWHLLELSTGVESHQGSAPHLCIQLKVNRVALYFKARIHKGAGWLMCQWEIILKLSYFFSNSGKSPPFFFVTSYVLLYCVPVSKTKWHCIYMYSSWYGNF